MKRKAEGLPSRLDLARRAKGMILPELADRAGLSVSGLNKWLAGSAAPRANNLRRAAEALGVSVGWLMGESEAGGPDHEALQDAKDDEQTAEMTRILPHMKAARARELAVQAREEDPEDRRDSARFGPAVAAPSKPAAGLLFGQVDPGRLDSAFREALVRCGIQPADLGDTNALMLLTILLHDAAVKRKEPGSANELEGSKVTTDA